MKTLLVSLVSDQTLPNVQFIKELIDQVDVYLFLTTAGMESSGKRKWIINATKIDSVKEVTPIIVDQFSFDDITTKLDSFDFSAYNKIIVNLTGGTKVMTLAADVFFKDLGSEIYYITGSNNNDFIKLFPGRKKTITSFNSRITIAEYLKAYGFSFEVSALSGISIAYTKHFFNLYCDKIFDKHKETINSLRAYRKKGLKKKELVKREDILNFLAEIEFPVEIENGLTAVLAKYLTGDWFEEYIGLHLKEELGLSDDELMIGVTLHKEIPPKVTNDVTTLLGDVKVEDKAPNEFDVMFVYNNRFYSIECKTSIIDKREVLKNNEMKSKDVNILGDTIYKADSLKNKFGLFANSSIITLTCLKEYIEIDDKGTRNNRIQDMSSLINRANLSRIKLIDREMIRGRKTFFELLK